MVAADTDPWTGEILAEIPMADAADLDEALAAVEGAQREWAAAPPARRAEVMLAAAEVLQAREAEVISWLICETGGTRAQAELEWSLVRSVTLEAASVPYQVTGTIVPSDVPGQEIRVHRGPHGVVAAISPWRFGMHLSNRAVAAALATGNAVASRLVVDRKVYQEFTDRLVAAVRCLRAGDPAAEDTDIGPVINARLLSAIGDKLSRARAEGARQLLGGEPGGPTGLLLPPHVLLAGKRHGRRPGRNIRPSCHDHPGQG